MKKDRRIGNNHGALTASDKKRLGDTPKRWRYDGTKLYMLFREGDCSYLVIERAIIREAGASRIGILEDGTEFVLKESNRSETLAA